MKQITQILFFSKMTVLQGSKSLFENDTFSKQEFVMEVSGLCLPYEKRFFQEHQWSAFLFMAQITQILLLSWMPLSKRSKITVWERKLFKNKFIYGSFWFVSTLRKKVFSGAPMKSFSLHGLNNSDSVVFGNPGFAETIDHGLRTKTFQKEIYLWKFWVCIFLTWKGISRSTNESFFFFMAQITWTLLLSGMPLLERSKITV